MTPSDFIKQYETALGTQKWDVVSPLISDGASVTFSDGSVHKGKGAVRAAFEQNFEVVKDEDYKIANVHWLSKTSESAVYMFDFFWNGLIEGRKASGSGRGTAVLISKNDKWQLLAEHLGPSPQQ
ncbi:nuclear transport factor 2 family protein [Flexibacterium corallicola]|uniref:nuclear transport factor 2 family protein n=1 Tax=Flexibacterium corallicola TaxID=3037259 RepID=UPI00286EDA2E|nr:nuclear transport factor 2 family protein [Pseudovibrio sp. M1P-2-3]